jgi:3',5'-cyclic AMP phosphodiesterase CpdA
MLVAHISDFHILPHPALCYGFSDPRKGLTRAIAALEELRIRPDLVVASGDLVDEPSAEAYRTLKSILSGLTVPFVIIPGNHDDRTALSEAFPEHDYLNGFDGKACFVRDYDAFRLVAFDAVITGREYAEPSDAALTWLDQTLLSEPSRPTMLVMHHPPISTGIAFMDAIQPPNFAGLEAILQDHRHVKLILCGHVHRHVDAVLAHARVAAAGSTAHQFSLLTDLDAPPAVTDEPAAIRLHLWRNGQVVSFTTPVERSFATGQFMGMDEVRWRDVSAALREGQGRGATAPDAAIGKVQ